MWRTVNRGARGLPALLVVGVAACVNLDVDNPNEPDITEALGTAAAVEAHIASAFTTWFKDPNAGGVYAYHGPTLALSAASFQHGAPWSNAGMAYFSQVPRRPIVNRRGDAWAPYLLEAWYASYRAIAAVRDGLRQIDAGRVDLGETGTRRARAFGRYMQGLAHGAVALMYDSGYVSDETLPLDSVRLHDYHAVMDAALRYLADAAELAHGADFTIPASWMSNATPADELARLARSWSARLRAGVARTPAERAAVDWAAVEADVRAGITEDWEFVTDWEGFFDEAFLYGHYDYWQLMSFWVYGMADQSGAYQAWINSPARTCQRPNDRCQFGFLVVTPDTRFPRGTTRDEQVANPGAYFERRMPGIVVWSEPTLYRSYRWDWWTETGGPIPLVSVREIRHLLAEAAYRRGDFGTVAEIVNETRTLYGLNATDAGGLNTSCVPRLPDGTCGDLWEMLKWEKRIETAWLGPLRAGWYFDGRGWGDLVEGTFLQVPVPYSEMVLLLNQPYDFGGVGGEWAAPVGTYGY